MSDYLVRTCTSPLTLYAKKYMKITGYFCTECQSSKCIGHKNIFLKFRKKGFSMKRLLCWLWGHGYIYPPKMRAYTWTFNWECSVCGKQWSEKPKNVKRDKFNRWYWVK